MKIHELKIESQYLNAIISREKTFEIRLNDRDYEVNDILNLKGCDNGVYTGVGAVVEVTYAHEGLGLQEGYIAMSIECISSDILFR